MKLRSAMAGLLAVIGGILLFLVLITWRIINPDRAALSNRSSSQ